MSDNPEQNNHGGARAGAGRPRGTGAKKSYGAAAKAVSANAERIAVNLGGEAWEMRQEEKDAIDAALTDIFTAWEYDGMNNPYAALVLASGMYIFGPGRATPAGMWTRTREFFARRKEAKESAAATDDETDENESPAD